MTTMTSTTFAEAGQFFILSRCKHHGIHILELSREDGRGLMSGVNHGRGAHADRAEALVAIKAEIRAAARLLAQWKAEDEETKEQIGEHLRAVCAELRHHRVATKNLV